MRISKRMTAVLLATTALAAAATAALAVSATTAANAGTKSPAHVVLNDMLLPSEPSFPALHGVSTDKAPWLLERGTVRLRNDGELQVNLRGLIIPSLGTAGGVSTVHLALYCANETTAGATSASFPLSSAGDATIETTIALPLTCLAPVILVTPNENPSIYIAETGLGSY
jgi:hypothetical protein